MVLGYVQRAQFVFIDAEPNSVTVLNDHSPVISITRADQELSNVAVTEPTLHGSNLMQNSSNIHVFPISNLQDGLDNNSTLSQMQTDKIDPIQNDDVTLASLKPTQYVSWKRIAREAKTGVAGPDSVSRKGKRAITVIPDEVTIKRPRLSNDSVEL
ncbi:hypothetical protein ACOSQ3_012756 [Xanthoceras sorbifolium]